eukprot:7327383-Karenia_brevis.AAC.1
MFGIGRAGYWWGRLGGTIGRIVWSLLGQCNFWIFLFAEDLDFLAAGTDAIADIALTVAILHMIGTPISWRKVSGGFHYEWKGYWQNLK